MKISALANFSIILCLCMFFCACFDGDNSIDQSSDVGDHSLIGTWKFMYSKSVYANSTITVDSTEVSSVYIINKKRFTFISSQGAKGDLLYAGYGRYSLNNGGKEFIEHIEYHSTPEAIGRSVKFKSKVEGDIWTHEGYIPIHKNNKSQLEMNDGKDQYQIIEVRRRIK